MWNCERQESKKRYFAYVFFCKVFDNEYRGIFRDHFPNVTNFVGDLKARDYRHAG